MKKPRNKAAKLGLSLPRMPDLIAYREHEIRVNLKTRELTYWVRLPGRVRWTRVGKQTRVALAEGNTLRFRVTIPVQTTGDDLDFGTASADMESMKALFYINPNSGNVVVVPPKHSPNRI